MLKTLTFSVGLAFALCAGSVALAGHHGVVASEQCAAPCEQSVLASPQGECCAPAGPCGLVKMKHKLCEMFKPKPKCYTYTWVLKKKRVWGHHGCGTGTCGSAGCDTCGVTASEQYPSAQGAPAVYGTGQGYAAPAVYGAGQAYAAPTTYSVPSAGATSSPMAPSGDEAPPAPAMEKMDSPAPPTPSTPEVPEAPDAPKVSSNGSLLFLAPSAN